MVRKDRRLGWEHRGRRTLKVYVSSGINENELCSLQRKADFLDCGSEDQEGGIQGGRDDSRSIENIHQESHIYSNVTRHRMLYIYIKYISQYLSVYLRQGRKTGLTFIHLTNIFKCLFCVTLSLER